MATENRPKYWFTLQQPDICTYLTPGLWLRKNSADNPPDLKTGDKAVIYEVQEDVDPDNGDVTRSDGIMAVKATLEVTDLIPKPLKNYWTMIAKGKYLFCNLKSSCDWRITLKILGHTQRTPLALRWNYAGRIKEISREQYEQFESYIKPK